MTGICSHDTSRPEGTGVKFSKDIALVANGKTKAWAKGTGLDLDFFAPVSLLDFVKGKRADPTELVFGNECVWFVWSDSSYAGAQTLKLDSSSEDALRQARALLKITPLPALEISDEWWAAVDKIRHSGAEHILIFKDHLEGRFESGSSATGDRVCELIFPLETPIPEEPEGECLKIPMRLIEPALRVATSIDFTSCPQSLPFKSDSVAGVIEQPISSHEG